MKINQISSFKIGHSIKGFFLCNEKYFKNTRLGDSFIDLIISDSSGSIRCKIWKNVNFYNKKFDIGCPVAIKGDIINYNNTLEIDIKHISSIKGDEYNVYGFERNLIIRSSQLSSEKLWQYIELNIEKLSISYRKFIYKVYSKNKKKIISIPHLEDKYNLKGGYLNKIANIFKINNQLINLYSDLDYNKVISGILIKDIGCLDFFNDDLLFSVSKKGQLLDIYSLGINLINAESNSQIDLDEDIELFFKHIVSLKDGTEDLEAEYIDILFKLDSKFNYKYNKEN